MTENDAEKQEAPDLADVLRRAKERLRGHWWQGSFSDGLGPVDECKVCAAGAVLWAVTGSPHPRPDGSSVTEAAYALETLSFAIDDDPQALYESEVECVALFNDFPDRTEAEVLDAFDAAIAAVASPVSEHAALPPVGVTDEER